MKPRNKTSPFWTLPDTEFIELIKNSKRWKDVFTFFGIRNKGGNAKTLKSRITLLKLDTTHFLNRAQSSNLSRILTEEQFRTKWLTPNSNKDRTHVKEYLIKFKLLEYECVECGNDGFWNDKKLSLQLEHKNGISDDNTLDNLCFLCPNCHSQTPSYAGKKNKKIRCVKVPKSRPSKILWPTPQKMWELVWSKPTQIISEELGVSDVAVGKFCKKHSIKKPTRGYWATQEKLSKMAPLQEFESRLEPSKGSVLSSYTKGE